MPTISTFYGIIIAMFWSEHNPPHFHARYAEYKATYDFDGNRLDGKMPDNKEVLIKAWATLHKDEIAANWELAKEKEQIEKIDPLK
jgi:hypothetical protein